jgi:single-stranded-DNA-specific exonuclease
VLRKRWRIGSRNLDAEAVLRRDLGVSSLVAAVLASRGLVDPEAAEQFLNPSLDRLHSPKLLPDFDSAVSEILGARDRGDLIFVHGDYDVDGVTSASLFTRFLAKIGCKVHAHVPHRMKEGFGVHEIAIAAARDAGAGLFLTCDCGSSAERQVAMAHEAGMRVVVTDHHLVSERPPAAEALVNPHRADSVYPFPEISGVGVVFKLCAGITQHLGHPIEAYYRAYLDLAALGTIADVMPLVDENRIIASFGLRQLAETKKLGLQALMRNAKIDVSQPLRSDHVGYRIGPRINAVGRIDDAGTALRLLLTQDDAEAKQLADQLEALNTERRTEQERIQLEAETRVHDSGQDQAYVLVVGDPTWHAGIVGIVAGRLVERFHRPAFVLTVTDDGLCKGSARSIEGFHLGDALDEIRPLLSSGGGHAMAAGCSFRKDLLPDVISRLNSVAARTLTPEDLIPRLTADLEMDPADVTVAALSELDRLEPFGNANPRPIFASTDLALTQVRPTKNPAHVMLSLVPGQGAPVQAMAFGMAKHIAQIPTGSAVDTVYEPEINDFNGRQSVRWRILDIRPRDVVPS